MASHDTKPPSDAPAHLRFTSGALLARSVGWNLAGQLLPMIVGVIAVRPLVQGLGVERFGVLSLAWMLVGYFSLFDLGLGRALTKLVADDAARGDLRASRSMIWTAMLLMLAVGLAGALVAVLATPWLVARGLKITGPLQVEATASFYWLAVSIPIITVTSGLRGVLEARQRFSIVNAIRMPMSVLSFLGPLAVLPFSTSLVPVVIVLIVVRLGAAVAHLVACIAAFPELRGDVSFEWSGVAPVLSLGSWMTVTNVVGPLMAYLDRFFVGALLSVNAVAFYTAPFDVVTRLLVIPFAVAGVLFPAFAMSMANDQDRAAMLVARGTKYIFAGLLPVLLVVATLAADGLNVWLGPAFAENGTRALQWIAAGVFANALAQIPFAFLQAAGKPDVTAKLHVAELPFYLGLLWVLTVRMGIAGTAMAWTVRTVADGIFLFALASRLLPQSRPFVMKLAIATCGAFLIVFAGSQLVGLRDKLLFLTAALGAIGAIVWFVALTREERSFVLQFAPAHQSIQPARLPK